MQATSEGTAKALGILAKSRDLQAWETLVQNHGLEIQRLCQRILGDAALAEDACQETLLLLRDRAGQFKSEKGEADSMARSWILKIACNVALKMKRSQKSSLQRDESAGRTRAAAAPAESGETSAMNSETQNALHDALANLTEAERNPIVMRYFAEMEYDQMALAMGCPIDTVKKRVSRGIDKLRKRMLLLGIFVEPAALMQMLEHSRKSSHDPSEITADQAAPWKALLGSSRHPVCDVSTEMFSKQGGMSTMEKIGLSAAVLMLAVAFFAINQPSNGADSAPALPKKAAEPAPIVVAADKEPPAPAPAPAQPAAKPTKEDLDAVVEGNNNFALDMYAQLRQKPGNMLFSPYSVSAALGMTYAGARGETADQMAKVLHFTLGQEKLHPAFGAMIIEHNAVQKDGKPRAYELAVANRLFGQIGYHFVPAFLGLTRDAYGAELQQLDFKQDAEGSRKVINKWVEDRTKDKIQELIPPGLIVPDTRLVLTNAVYFKGKWEKPFEQAKTKAGPFTLESSQKIDTPFMHQISEFKYAEQDGVKALELPYAGGDLAMVALLPKDEKSLGDLEKNLDSKAVAGWVSKMAQRKVIVSIPKFKLTWGTEDLVPNFQNLGMTAPFDSRTADFSGMSGSRDLFIKLILHKAFMDVNEEGTEAAAATAVIVMRGGAAPARPPQFIADHPFICLIRDVKSGAILFMCRVMEPKQ